MTKERMTIHKALAELKIIDKRIGKAIDEGNFCTTNKHSNNKIIGVSIEEYKKLMVGSYDKASDLIKRRNAIKRAVVLSNATTKVKINEEEFTVAEAIEMKNHGIENEVFLLEEMKNQYSKTKAVLLKENGQELEQRAENYVIGLYGSKEGKTNTDDFERAKRDYITANTFDLIDPIDIVKKINELEEYISSFKAEVDAALSCSNAITEIEIEY